MSDAIMIHVRAPGTLHVGVDVDGTVGVFATAAEHGVNKLPEQEKPGKKKKKKMLDVLGGGLP